MAGRLGQLPSSRRRGPGPAALRRMFSATDTSRSTASPCCAPGAATQLRSFQRRGQGGVGKGSSAKKDKLAGAKERDRLAREAHKAELMQAKALRQEKLHAAAEVFRSAYHHLQCCIR
ncbi:hypothetical protein HaLaN_27671 [Haematococcus lacustris]|uniref:Uncharacterized protein n=1 Tax=Haematococcus lacustris TaxID=44745 RepID=A0A6A0A8Z1_HAELA|nr:hypothetical protein HaLaN_27671 [Haematococcus lacustris]